MEELTKAQERIIAYVSDYVEDEFDIDWLDLEFQTGVQGGVEVRLIIANGPGDHYISRTVLKPWMPYKRLERACVDLTEGLIRVYGQVLARDLLLGRKPIASD